MNTPQTPESLNARFAKPGLHFDAGAGGLTRMTLHNDLCHAEFYLHGSHITHWQPSGHMPVLFLSKASLYQSDKPIRGGVPICWPWFGPRENDTTAPMHGFARLTEWEVISVEQNSDGSVTVVTQLPQEPRWRIFLQSTCKLQHRMVFGRELSMTLSTHNTSPITIEFYEALHTYLAVGDVRQALITGLSGVQYISKVEGGDRKTQTASPITFTGETDRVYLNTQNTCILSDPAWKRSISVSKTGSQSTVIWNPWIAKAKAMADFGDEEWPEMVCIETANALDNRVQLRGGETNEMNAVISVEKGK